MNFFPMNSGGGNVEMDLLWTNSAPTTAMTTLSIPLDLSGYEYFVVYTENKSGYYANYENHDYCMKASNQFVGTYYGSGSGAYRYFDFSDNGIEIGDIYNSNANYRLYCQPTKIYGIRKGAGGSSGGGITSIDVAQGSSAPSRFDTSYTAPKDGFIEAICDLQYNNYGWFQVSINSVQRFNSGSKGVNTFYWKCDAGDIIDISISSNSYYDINYLVY